MDYKGGTYISQVDSTSIEVACIDWAKKLKVGEIENFGESSKDKLIEQMKIEPPVALKDSINLWCHWVTLYQGSALINIIQTET